jgi:hypothetical protein
MPIRYEREDVCRREPGRFLTHVSRLHRGLSSKEPWRSWPFRPRAQTAWLRRAPSWRDHLGSKSVQFQPDGRPAPMGLCSSSMRPKGSRSIWNRTRLPRIDCDVRTAGASARSLRHRQACARGLSSACFTVYLRKGLAGGVRRRRQIAEFVFEARDPPAPSDHHLQRFQPSEK